MGCAEQPPNENDLKMQAAAAVLTQIHKNCGEGTCSKERKRPVCVGYAPTSEGSLNSNLIAFPNEVFEKIKKNSKTWHNLQDCAFASDYDVFYLKDNPDRPVADLFYCDQMTESVDGITMFCGIYTAPMWGHSSDYLVVIKDGKLKVTTPTPRHVVND